MSTVRWLTDSSSCSSSETFSVGIPCPVQPPPVEPAFLKSRPHDSIRSAVETLQVEEDAPQKSIKQSLSSWLTSAALHAALLLILIWVFVPLRALKSQHSVIHVSFSDPAPADAGEMKSLSVDLPSAPQPKSPQVIEEPREITEQLLEQFTAVDSASLRPNFSDSDNRSSQSNNPRTPGKSRFFGIDASGDSFVYVVDRSSSMTGRRFYRAIEELIDSVDSLQSHQTFHVILFAQGRLSMFNQDFRSAKLIPATEDNKQRLRRWLRRVGTSGGTIPDSSLDLAIKLRPSAIFLLSDGEFTGPGFSRRTPHAGARQTLSLVKRSGRQIPIHTIAFEDPRSCRNLQLIAEITAGSYRFIERPGNMQNQMLRRVDQILGEAHSRQRGLDLQHVSREFARESTDEGRQQFVGKICADLKQNPLAPENSQTPITNASTIEQTLLYLECLVRNDSRRIHSRQTQTRLLDQLASGLEHSDDVELIERICQHVARLPTSPASRLAVEALTKSFQRIESLDCATRCLLDIRRSHEDTQTMAAMQSRFDALMTEMTSTADHLLDSGETLAALEALIEIRQRDDVGAAGVMIDKRIAQLTLDQLCIAKQAQIANDRSLRDSITARLDSIFQSMPQILHRSEQVMVQREIDARRIMRHAKEICYRRPKDAEKDFRTIIDQYPETITAASARQMLGIRAPSLPDIPTEKTPLQTQLQLQKQSPTTEPTEASTPDNAPISAPISMEELSRLMDDS